MSGEIAIAAGIILSKGWEGHGLKGISFLDAGRPKRRWPKRGTRSPRNGLGWEGGALGGGRDGVHE